MWISEGKALQKEQQVKKKINQWFIHVIAKRLAKQTPFLFLSFKIRPDYSLIEFSILTHLWRQKSAAGSPYCISVWIGKEATLPPGGCFPVSRHTAWGWECGLDFRPHSFLSQLSLYRAQLTWHHAKALTDFAAPWNNFSFNRKGFPISSYIYKGGSGEGANLILLTFILMRK